MLSSVRKSGGDDTSPNGDGQAPKGPYSEFAARLQSAASKKNLNSSALGGKVGLTRGTMARYWDGSRLPPSDTLISLSETLEVSPTWLIRGTGPNRSALVGADEADWIEVPEYDIRELTDETRGPVVSTTPIRKDWLNQTFGTANGLWLARLPADLPRFSLREGDLVFLRDLSPGEAQDGAIYIVRVWGHLTVARIDSLLLSQMRTVEANLEDRALAPRDIGTEDGKAILVARVLGAPLRRL